MQTTNGLPAPRPRLACGLAVASASVFSFTLVLGIVLWDVDGAVGATTLRTLSRSAFAVAFVGTALGVIAGLWAGKRFHDAALFGRQCRGWHGIARIATWANMAIVLGLTVAFACHGVTAS